MLGLKFGYGTNNNQSNTGQNLIRYKSGFTRRVRHSSHIPIQELLEFGVNNDAAMFRWRSDVDYNREIFPNSIKGYDLEDIRNMANKAFRPSFTVYDDIKMKTISRQFLEHNKDHRKMSLWASLIGAYFIRRIEEVYHFDDDEYDMIDREIYRRYDLIDELRQKKREAHKLIFL